MADASRRQLPIKPEEIVRLKKVEKLLPELDQNLKAADEFDLQ